VPASTATVTRVTALLPGRVGIDGPDAAGKTTLARAVAAAAGVPHVAADDFLAPPAVRHADESAAGYYANAFDLPALRAAVLAHASVVCDGVFLFRPELDDLWDARVFLDVDPDEQWRRVLARDVARFGSEAATRARYESRYLPAYAAYRAAVRPDARADVLL
jgi:uridine kinase